MEAILEQLGLGPLWERCSDENWIHIVLAMSESALIRLGVAAMGDRIRIKQLCTEAVDCSGSRTVSILSTAIYPDRVQLLRSK